MRAHVLLALGSLILLAACNPTLFGTCQTNADCPSDLTCETGICVRPTSGDASSPDGSTPSADGGTLDAGAVDAGSPMCLTNTDCQPSQTCENGMCVTHGCSTNADCQASPVGPVCDPMTGACVRCLADNQCGPGELCMANSCVPAGEGQPCGTNNICPQGLVCVPGNPPTCRQACSLTAAEPGCATDRRCGIATEGVGYLIAACLPSNGRGQDGARCQSSGDCDVNLACAQGECRRLCDPSRSTEACPAPNACADATALDASNRPVMFGGCEPPPSQCTSNASCAPGQVCAATPSAAASGGLANECIPPVGSQPAGQFCGQDGDCQSGQCIGVPPASAPDGAQGYCQGGCSKDADCAPSGNGLPGACEQVAVTWTDSSGQHTSDIASCVAQCKSETDCDGSTSCIPVENVQGTSWVTQCQDIQYANLKKLGGADCFNGNECTSGVCHHFQGSTGGICLGICDPSNGTMDCAQPSGFVKVGASCPADGVLLPLANGTQAVMHTCWGASCQTNKDCNPLHICANDPDPTNPSKMIKHCRPQ